MKDIKIQVPNGYLDIDTNIGFGVTYSIDDVKGLQKKNTSFSKTITLLGTKNNAILMGQLFDIKSTFDGFNPNFKTPAKIIVDSTTIIDGYMQLKNIKKLANTDYEGNQIQYEVVIFSNVVDFYSKIGDSLLTDLDLSEYNHTYTQSNIAATWSNTSGYTYPLMYKGTDTYITNDFKPAIFYKTYLNKIADATGFELGGSFLNNASFIKEIIPFNGPLINMPDSEWERRAFRVGMSGASQTLTSDLKLMGGVYPTTTLGTATNKTASLATSYSAITSLNDEVTPPNNDANNHWDVSTQKWTIDGIGKYNINARFNIKTTYKTYRDDIVSITGTGGSFIIVTFASAHNFVPGSTPVVTISGASSYNGTYTSAFVYDTNAMGPKSIRINGITYTGDIGSGGTFSWNTYNTGYNLNGTVETSNADNITWQYLNNVAIFKNNLQLATFTYLNSVPRSTGVLPTFFSGNSWTQTTTIPIQINYPNQQYFVGDEITFKANQQNWTNQRLLKYAESAVASGYDSVPVYVDFELVPSNGSSDTYVGVTAIKQDDLQDGDSLIMANYIPAKVKQKDLIDDLIKRYNIYSTVDPTNPNKIILETRDDFYSQTNVVDWTNLVDYNFEQKIQFLSELQNKEITFTYKKDNDIWNKNYTLATGGEEDGDVYGQKTIEFDSEFVFNKTKIETTFSPTPSIPNSVNSRFIVPAIYTSQPKTNIRTLLYNGLKDPLNTSGGAGVYSWYWEWYGTGSTLNRTFYYQYPQALHQDDISNPTMDINWGEVPYEYGISGGTAYTTSNNLYNHYWKNYMEQLNEGRLVTMKIYLDEVNIDAVKDKLYSKVWIRDAYFYISKIVDFDPTNNDSTEVELLKINDGIPFVSESNTATTISDYEAFRQSNYPPEDLTNVNLSRNAQIFGSNNFVGEDVYGQVIGDNNSITNFRGIVIGSGITDTDGIDGGIILDNAFIDSSGQIFNLSGESISNNFCASGLTASIINSCSNGNMTIGGGIGWGGNEYANVNTGDYSSVMLGGFNNTNSGSYGTSVIGGYGNVNSGSFGSSIIGGKYNKVSGGRSAIIGGQRNYLFSGYYSSMVGGSYNFVSGNASSMVGGSYNLINGNHSAMVGGSGNTVSGNQSSIIGGLSNLASGSASFIGGGVYNISSGNYSSVVGGRANSAVTGYYATVIGGRANLASGPNSSVIGGYANTATTPTSGVFCGEYHIANGINSSIIGGVGNIVSGTRSVVIGGQNITGTTDDTVYVPNLNIGTVGVGTSINNLGIDSSGNVVVGDSGTGGTSSSGVTMFNSGTTSAGEFIYCQLEIGVWDMDANISKNVPLSALFSVNEVSSFRNIVVLIKDNSDTVNALLEGVNGNFTYSRAGGFNLIRTAAGYFDNTSWNSTGVSRGYISFFYLPD